MKKGEIYEGRVQEVLFPDKAIVVTDEGETAQVKYGIPGQKLRFRVKKKRKEKIEVHNNADQTIYQLEKTLGELGDKVDAADKSNIEAKIEELKKVKDSDDIEAVKKAMEEANQAFYAVSQKIYQQAGAQPGAEGFDPNMGAQGGAAGPQDDNVVDADFKVDDDK